MNLLIIILSVIDLMVALLLIAVILVQQSKDGGFGGAPFGGAGEAVFGGQAGDHLSKFTVILTTMFFIITLSLAIVTGRRTGGETSVVEDDAAVAEITAVDDNTKQKKDGEGVLQELADEKEKPANPIKVEKKPVQLKKKDDKIVAPISEKPEAKTAVPKQPAEKK